MALRILETDACIFETDTCILETDACIFETDACIFAKEHQNSILKVTAIPKEGAIRQQSTRCESGGA